MGLGLSLFSIHDFLHSMKKQLRAAVAALIALACVHGVAQTIDNGAQPEVFSLKFGEFFKTPVGPSGLELSEKLKALDGRIVSLTGYMVLQELPSHGKFLMTPRPVQMSEHSDGDADDLPPATVTVVLDAEQQAWTVPHVRGWVSVTGKLSVGRQEAVDGRVTWVRLQLGPESARRMNAFEVATYLHALQHKH